MTATQAVRQTTMAEPLERLAAFLVDLQVVLLLGGVATSRVRLYLSDAVLLDDHETWLMNGLLLVLIFYLVALAYETITQKLFQGTVGKRLFALSLQNSVANQALEFEQVLLRASLKWASWPWLLPLLGILKHPQRLALHDRTCATVVTSAASSIEPPTRGELFLASGVKVAFWLLLTTGVLTAVLRFAVWKDSARTRLVEVDSHPTEVCGLGPNRGSLSVKAHLTDLLMRHVTGDVTEDCFAAELDRATSSKALSLKGKLLTSEEWSLIYFARSIRTSDDPHMSRRYLDLSCKVEPLSDACRVVGLVNGDHIPPVTSSASATTELSALWKLRLDLRKRDFASALEALNFVQLPSWGARFLTESRAQALSGLGRLGEAEQLLAVSEAWGPRLSLQEFSFELCLAQTRKSCDNRESRSCQLALSLIRSQAPATETRDLVNYRLHRCGVSDGPNRSQFKSISTLAEAENAFLSNRRSKGLQLLREAFDQTENVVVEEEVIVRALSQIKTRHELYDWKGPIQKFLKGGSPQRILELAQRVPSGDLERATPVFRSPAAQRSDK